MLPYDGITRTGSKGLSHSVRSAREDPQRASQGKGKTSEKQAKPGIIEPRERACYTAMLNTHNDVLIGRGECWIWKRLVST